jgi:hypothetical protein
MIDFKTLKTQVEDDMAPDRMGEQLVCMTLDDLVRLLLD